jgi:hypothetical protein
MITLPEINKDIYLKNEPFPHIVLDNVFDNNFLQKISDEFASFKEWDGVINYYGSRNKRFCSDSSKLPENVLNVIHKLTNKDFLLWLEKITGEQALMPDPYLYGGGMHSTTKGGFLKMHADFNWHKKINLFRRLNLLLYLNKNWREEWGGNLELSSKDVNNSRKSIIPIFNRMVIFTTDDNSFHGQPSELNCPEQIWRNSIALYYYSSIKPRSNFYGKRVGTDYVPLKEDKFKRNSFIKRLYGKIKYAIFPN